MTCYLALYYGLFLGGAPASVIGGLYAGAPFLVTWMVIVILKYGAYKGKELKADEEWGYEDQPKESLGVLFPKTSYKDAADQ